MKEEHKGSWAVVEWGEFNDLISVYGAFQTKEEAERYAKKAFYLGRDTYEKDMPLAYNSFTAVPWNLANPNYR